MSRVSNQHGISCCPFQIVIPFFSLFIKDIYFLNEGCASRLPNGHINFEVSQILLAGKIMDLLQTPFQKDCIIWAYNQFITLYIIVFTSKLGDLRFQIYKFDTYVINLPNSSVFWIYFIISNIYGFCFDFTEILGAGEAGERVPVMAFGCVSF